MKKILSLFITLVLVLSLFTVTAVAFAAEETTDPEPEPPAHAPITVDNEAFRAQIASLVPVQSLPEESKFHFNSEWLLNKSVVESVFSGIVYELKNSDPAAEGVTETSKYELTENSDKIFLEYCTPSKDYKEEWSCISVTSDVNVATTGWWGFRYVVKDKDGKTGTKEFLQKTERVYVYFGDDKPPVITSLSTTMKDLQNKGIKVGDSYTIKTDVSVTETSGYTTSYVVFKKVNGKWTDEPIYDSKKPQEVADEYKEGISSGKITMLEQDVLPENEPVYRIVYTVKDNLGYESNPQEFLLFATAEEKEGLTSNQIWQIVLYAIAGLSLIGIFVVIFVKPKQAPETNNARPKNDANSEEPTDHNEE